MINFDPFLEEYPIAKRKRLATPYNFLPYFFINGVAYNLPYGGATWEEWINSRYNTVQNLAITDDLIFTQDEEYAVIDNDQLFATRDSLIIPYKEYSYSNEGNGLFSEQTQITPWILLRNQNYGDNAEFSPLIEQNYSSGTYVNDEFVPDKTAQSPANVINSYVSDEVATYSLRARSNNPDKLIILSESFNKIGNNAFKGTKAIKKLRLPSKLTTIGTDAFEECQSLQEFSISANNENFSVDKNGILYNKDKTILIKCPIQANVTELILPASVQKISNNAFRGCVNLTKIVLTNVSHIGEYAFAECPNLQYIILSNNIERVGRYAFIKSPKIVYYADLHETTSPQAEALFLGNETNPQLVFVSTRGTIQNAKTYIIPSNTRVIGPDAMQNWYGSITNIMFDLDGESQCITIEDNAFNSMSSLIGPLTIPSSVRYIGDRAFAATRFTSVVMREKEISTPGKPIYEGVTYIGEQAFFSCHTLTNIELPRSLERVGIDAFKNTSLLPYEDVEGNGAYLGNNESHYILLYDIVDPFAEELKANKDIRAIYPTVFRDSALKKIDLRGHGIADSNVLSVFDDFTHVKHIPAGFCSGSAVEEVVLPNAVTTIGANAFAYCVNLQKITFGPEIKFIDQNAFIRCDMLKEVVLNQRANTQSYSAWFNIEFANLEANPLHIGIGLDSATRDKVELKQKMLGRRPSGDYYITVHTWENFIITEFVEEIKDYAFAGCSTLEYLVFTNAKNLKRIGKQAFYGCAYLNSSITIPESVTEIGYGAFAEAPINAYYSNNLRYKATPDAQLMYDAQKQEILQSKTLDFRIPTLLDFKWFGLAPLAITGPSLISGELNLGNINVLGDESISNIKFFDWDNASYTFQIGGKTTLAGGIMWAIKGLLYLLAPDVLQDTLVKDIFDVWGPDLIVVSLVYENGIGRWQEGLSGLAAPLKNCYYINKSVKSIPYNTFGDDHTAKIRYAGSQEEWNEISIAAQNTWAELKCLG